MDLLNLIFSDFVSLSPVGSCKNGFKEDTGR